MNNSKAAIAVSRLISTIQMLSGIFFLFCFGILTISYLFDAEYRAESGGDILFFLLFDALGVMLIIFSRKRSRLIKEFKKYVSVICSEQTDSIANLASAMGASPDLVKSKLELMIKRNYFVNAHINQETNCIIIGSAASNRQKTEQTQGGTQAQIMLSACKCCGGMNKIVKGSVAECDFCGAPISM